MKLTAADLNELAALAILAATAAGEMVATSRPQEVQRKEGAHSLASEVVTEIDERSEEMILDILNPSLERFELGLLTEEQEDGGSRFTTDFFWCVDPIDGTLPFIEGVPGYAVSIALVGSDGTPWIGVIYDPVEGTLFHAVKDAGAFRDREPWSPLSLDAGNVLSVYINRSFLSAAVHDAAMEQFAKIAQDRGLSGLQVHATAGAVMNASMALLAPPACYFAFPQPVGGGHIWDFAATACLYNELDAVATDIYGDPLDLNRADSTSMNHRGVLYVADATMAEQIQEIYRNLA